MIKEYSKLNKVVWDHWFRNYQELNNLIGYSEICPNISDYYNRIIDIQRMYGITNISAFKVHTLLKRDGIDDCSIIPDLEMICNYYIHNELINNQQLELHNMKESSESLCKKNTKFVKFVKFGFILLLLLQIILFIYQK